MAIKINPSEIMQLRGKFIRMGGSVDSGNLKAEPLLDSLANAWTDVLKNAVLDKTSFSGPTVGENRTNAELLEFYQHSRVIFNTATQPLIDLVPVAAKKHAALAPGRTKAIKGALLKLRTTLTLSSGPVEKSEGELALDQLEKLRDESLQLCKGGPFEGAAQETWNNVMASFSERLVLAGHILQAVRINHCAVWAQTLLPVYKDMASAGKISANDIGPTIVEDVTAIEGEAKEVAKKLFAARGGPFPGERKVCPSEIAALKDKFIRWGGVVLESGEFKDEPPFHEVLTAWEELYKDKILSKMDCAFPNIGKSKAMLASAYKELEKVGKDVGDVEEDARAIDVKALLTAEDFLLTKRKNRPFGGDPNANVWPLGL